MNGTLSFNECSLSGGDSNLLELFALVEMLKRHRHHPVGSTRTFDSLEYGFIMVVYEKIFFYSYFRQTILTEFLKNFS